MKEIIKLILDSVDVKQSSEDKLFNATQLNDAWSVDPLALVEYNGLNSTEDLIEFISEQEGIFPHQMVSYKDNETWFHPILFLDFAMFINPKFKYDILVHQYLSANYLNGKTLL